jgi:ABC-type antimicrobial peptide transport system permease subunit
MNRGVLVRRGLRFYRRTHLGVVAGCAVSAAVLVGALFVGDSVRGTLERIALARLGRIHSALESGGRYFRAGLAARMRDGLKTEVAAALHVQGMALREDASGKRTQINRVDIAGVDGSFFGLAETPTTIPLGPGKVALNRKLADALAVKVGDEVALRLFKPSFLSREAPLASRKEKDTRRSLATVSAVLDDDRLGRFSLKSDQAGPYTAFVDLAWLQETLDLKQRANLLVAGESAKDPREWLRSAWTLEDLGLAFHRPEGGSVVQLQSDRVYLDAAVSTAALGLQPQGAGVLYYLVDSLTAAHGKSTPYSFATALSPTADPKIGPVPAGMKDDEVLVNRWVADQLSVKEGDRLTLAYSVQTPGNTFVQKKRDFRIRGVLEMAALAGEKDLVPQFPGLTDVEGCKDWDIGIPLDQEKLKDPVNEAYWTRHRQTPKAFVTLAAGREMWGSRHGDLMAVRYPASATNATELRDALREHINPEETGLVFRPVREAALKAAGESMDLGQLFLGMSLFLIAASLLLTAMFFVFTVEQRAKEMGVLLAVGYPRAQVRRLFLAEGAVLAGLGSVLGIPLGWAFAKALILGLSSSWSGVVADTALTFHARPATALIGAAAGGVISLLAMAVALWRQAKRPVRELVAEDYSVSLEHQALASRGGKLRLAVFLLGTAGAAATAIGTLASGTQRPAEGFFGAGSLMLIGGLAGIRMALGRLSRRSTTKLSIRELGIRNAARRPGRSLATAAMLACGCFIVFAVSAMKEDLSLQAGERRSGTGGFRLYAESSIAIPEDLNGDRGRATYRLADKDVLKDVSILPVRVRDGDDASCLNLNQSLTPPLLGVDAARLSSLGAFGDPALWALLDRSPGEGIVPALVGDSATAMWKLKLKVGEKDGALLDYTDERGRTFKVKLVGALPPRLSVLQGRLLISDREFTTRFPSEGGYRTFLIDAPAGAEDRVRRYLAERLETAGFDIVPAVERLKEFYVVESSYLRLFMVLGGLGLLLGSAGMGVLVLRHVLERRGELALLRAVGYTKDAAARVVMAEHVFVLAAGLGTGVIAAALAIGPTALQPQNSIPFGLLAFFLIGTAALSAAWIRIAAGLALNSPLVPALRQE